ncbi:MAG TPA: cytochrome c oxidase subunit II [Bryobacteraceae bacterium]|nr:cytochrome c oxidase subunit II [Bryobacteraceae bacterium]
MPLGPVFTPHSPEAQAMSALFGAFLVLATVIFLIVAGLVTYGIVRYRARAGAGEPRQTFGSRGLEITWTAIPLLIVTVLFVFTVRTMASIDAPLTPDQPADIVITGHQWWWEARYRNGADTANEIHIPVGRRVLARIESVDVIHDFWVPQLARKMDAVPGRPAYVWLEADTAGTYSGTCSEFCGMQHAWMRFEVIAEPEADFSAWLAREAIPPQPPSGDAAEGARIFQQQKCGDCHAVSPADTRVLPGPPLTHIASRRLLGGEIPNTAENLTHWILTPQSIKPGNKMMDPRLSAVDVGPLSAYMESLR